MALTKLGSKTKELWQNPEYRKMMSEAHKGNAGFWKGKKLSIEARQNMSKAKLLNPTRYWLGKKCPHAQGENNPGWKGGVHPENLRQRNIMEYHQWRRGVFLRDDFRCLDCGQRGGRLEADHIYPFAFFERLRFDINNGQTLCKDCHKRTPTYGKKALNFRPQRRRSVIRLIHSPKREASSCCRYRFLHPV